MTFCLVETIRVTHSPLFSCLAVFYNGSEKKTIFTSDVLIELEGITFTYFGYIIPMYTHILLKLFL